MMDNFLPECKKKFQKVGQNFTGTDEGDEKENVEKGEMKKTVIVFLYRSKLIPSGKSTTGNHESAIGNGGRNLPSLIN